MKQLRFTLFVLGVLMLSIIAFYTFNILFSLVSNYEALDIISLSGIPMYLMFINIMIIVISGYRYFMKKEPDLYYVRYYSVVVGVIALIGLGMSIFVGTAVYGSFVKDYVFKCYPLISLIVFTLMLGGSIALFVMLTRKFKAEGIEKTYKGTFVYGLREAGLSILVVYALVKLGAFTLMPIYWSSYDGVYVIPFLIQLLVPTLIVVTYIIHEDFLRNRKVTFILSCIAFGYTLFSLIYMILMTRGNYPLTINPLSTVQQLERLVTFPVSSILLYGVCLLIPLLNGLNNGILLIKEKKASKTK